MKLTNNTPKIFRTYQDQAIRTPNIEDGNTVANSKQGKIFTSEIDIESGYFNDYTANVVSTALLLNQTGNQYSCFIVIDYTVVQEPSATNPGFYGSDIIKENDVFTIVSGAKDYVRGYITKISDTQVVLTAPSTYTYTYSLVCTIIQGDPVTISNLDTFIWKRSLYMDKTSFDDAYVPINLKGAKNNQTGEINFYWEDIQKESRRYLLKLRNAATSNPPIYGLFPVTGTIANGDVSLLPFLDGIGNITTIKIEKPGKSIHSDRTLDIVGSGSGESWRTNFDYNGSLRIDDCRMYYWDPFFTNQILVQIDRTERETGNYPIPKIGSYIEGLTSLGSTRNFYIQNVTAISNREYVLDISDAATGLPIVGTPVWATANINKTLKIHSGVERLSAGGGYFGKARASLKKIPNNSRFYIDPNILPIPSGKWAWSVAAIYDEINNKIYTEWTPEEYLQL
jgi:hypothetical protein